MVVLPGYNTLKKHMFAIKEPVLQRYFHIKFSIS